MKRRLLDVYVCPLSHGRLQPKGGAGADEISSGELVSPEGTVYAIVDGIPNFILPSMLSPSELATQNEYQIAADKTYDAGIDWLFASFHENEETIREGMIDQLDIKPGGKVLEIGCGTGRDSFRIARRLDAGEFYVQDLSPKMVEKTCRRLGADRPLLNIACDVHCFVSTGSRLPFADGYFDSVFHFGGFNNFTDQKQSLREFTRVVRKGGKIVVGDESIPPWLENTEFGRIVKTNNAMFDYKVPLESIPSNARDVVIRWVLGGCFYVIEFKVGDGTPPLDIDLPHEGWRGGTMRTRYFGRLEGVTVEAKRLAIEAARKSGVSVHEWLDRLVREGAKKT